MDYVQLLFAAAVHERAMTIRTAYSRRHVDELGLIGAAADQARKAWLDQHMVADYEVLAFDEFTATAVRIEALRLKANS